MAVALVVFLQEQPLSRQDPTQSLLEQRVRMRITMVKAAMAALLQLDPLLLQQVAVAVAHGQPMEQRFQLDDLEVLEVAQVLPTSYQAAQGFRAKDMRAHLASVEM